MTLESFISICSRREVLEEESTLVGEDVASYEVLDLTSVGERTKVYLLETGLWVTVLFCEGIQRREMVEGRVFE